tara:strand:- start:3744 stop:4868 length:1125 start_codon:yes stop_codon:yes gene_type:complete
MLRSRFLSIALNVALLEALAPILLMTLYLFSVDLVYLIKIPTIIISLLIFPYALKPKYADPVSAFAFLLIALEIIKLFFVQEADLYRIAVRLYSVSLPFIALMFLSGFRSYEDKYVQAMLLNFARRYVFLSIPLMLLYALLYYSGEISYFGMSTNLHYALPYFFNSLRWPLLICAVIVVTGKRAIILTTALQILLYLKSLFGRSPVKTLFTLVILGVCVSAATNYTQIFSRFEKPDSDSAGYSYDLASLSRATSGRSDELVGIKQYFDENPEKLLFGSLMGEKYVWRVESGDVVEKKDYSHMSVATYVFRHGLFGLAFFLVLVFVYFAAQPSFFSPAYVVGIAVLFNSLVGANLVVDIMSWLLIGIGYKFSRRF